VFVLGTQYLRGETPHRADWDRDLAAVRGAGFNTVRAWLVWNVLEPAPGRIDHRYLHEFLDAAGRNGLRVGLLFHLHAAPEWAVRRHRRQWYVDARGAAFEPAQRNNTPSGGWPGLCFDHTATWRVERRFISTVVRSVRSRGEVAFWEPMNEPHQWVDLSQDPVGFFCYCHATRRLFQLWLRERYGSLERLAEAWGRRHRSWDDVRPPTWIFGHTDLVDFRLFTMDRVAAEVSRRAELIRSLDGRPVIAHAWGGGEVTCLNLGAMAFDDWKNAVACDAWGYSAFPDSPRDLVMIGLGTDATRGAAAGKEFWQAELGTGDLGSGLHRRGRVPPQVLSLWSWESLRHGVHGLLYWQYRKERQGTEIGGVGLTDTAGGRTSGLRAASAIARCIGGNAELFATARPMPARVAILFSLRSYLVDWCEHRSCRLSIDCLSGYYRMFWERSIPVDILHEDHLDPERLSQYRMIVLPLPCAAPGRVARALLGYVQAGGMVVSDPLVGSFDDHLHLPTHVPGNGWGELFGVEVLDSRTVEGEPVEVSCADRSFRIRGCRFRDAVSPGAADVVATFADDGTPAATSARAGSGRALLLALDLGHAHAPRTEVGDELKRRDGETSSGDSLELFDQLTESAGLAPDVGNLPRGVVGSVLSSDSPSDVLILLNTTSERIEAAPCFPEGRREAVDLLQEASPIAIDGVTRLALEPLASRVFRLDRPCD
jgi:beta-galactosidase GanA